MRSVDLHEYILVETSDHATDSMKSHNDTENE